jgi:hypothetical protein
VTWREANNPGLELAPGALIAEVRGRLATLVGIDFLEFRS